MFSLFESKTTTYSVPSPLLFIPIDYVIMRRTVESFISQHCRQNSIKDLSYNQMCFPYLVPKYHRKMFIFSIGHYRLGGIIHICFVATVRLSNHSNVSVRNLCNR